MKVLLKTNTLNFRGTTVAIEDYAKYNERILGNESIICYRTDIPYQQDMGNESIVIDRLKRFGYHLEEYQEDTFNDLMNRVKPDVVYQLTSGDDRDRVNVDCKSVVHSVFQSVSPNITAYISDWLSDKLTDGKVPYVPHIVNLPEPTDNYREFLNIPKDALVIGRHGGLSTFDIGFVRDYVNKCQLDNVYFVFVGTERFTYNSNCLFINQFSNRQKLSNYINTCDIMLHARQRGESFGLAICEFLFHNKPVLAYNGGVDQNHVRLLSGFNTLYSDVKDLNDMIVGFRNDRKLLTNHEWSSKVSEYKPERAIQKFKEIFL